MLQGGWPSLPLWHPHRAPTHPAPWGCFICLSSLPEFVFLLLWFSHCWYKQEQNSPAWLRLCFLWWELLLTSVRPEPTPPNTNVFKPGLALTLETSHRFCSIKPKMYQHTSLMVSSEVSHLISYLEITELVEQETHHLVWKVPDDLLVAPETN